MEDKILTPIKESDLKEIRMGEGVKCIDGHFEDNEVNPFKISELSLPKEGNFYTIREIVDKDKYGYGFRLNEIKNKKFYFSQLGLYEEPIFNISRFDKTQNE